ncbi:ribose 5-phosphate isomerase B [Providencia burhodogranariea]|uniref:Ribose-5-phosphate isomerase B n=1 Tax=Providencia burhodogranariea DSM 19968 TaxID=1141662 RepID=K8WPF2_9GAMM|nr:ribose 5-phosphate isomerase B [Providencia burhodogranariea]EKT62449.1 ribose-5-phosphate isomerase B [Providencia burhodogranariea DSM 19968]
MLSLAIGADDAAFEMKDLIKEHLKAFDIEVTDYSHNTGVVDEMYPDVAHAVASAISQGKHQRGILICGTGIGMSIVANKVIGIRAALCHDTYSAERAQKSNDAQIITFGARVIGPELAKSIVDTWLSSEYDGGRSAPKVARINEYENRQR